MRQVNLQALWEEEGCSCDQMHAAAAQADARGPGAERLDAEEEVGEAEAVDTPSSQRRGFAGIARRQASQMWRTSYSWSRCRPARPVSVFC